MILTIIKRFASKVDSLNWQSISYQDKAFDTVHDQLYKAVMEVIGEDEHEWIEATPSQRTVAESLNQLRQSQRQKLNKLFGKGENN